MRSTLVRTGIWVDNEGIPMLNLRPDRVPHVDTVLEVIENFILEARQAGSLSFEELYQRLMSPEHHIGLRKGLIPIFLAAVIHEHKREVIISDQYGQVATSADVLLQINSKPQMFTLSYLDWNPEKENFVANLSRTFDEYVVNTERGFNSYDYVVSAMRRWYMALPKYAKESRKGPDGRQIQKSRLEMMKLLRQNASGSELLFERLPRAFGFAEFHEEVADNVNQTKQFYDNYIYEVKRALSKEVKELFVLPKDEERIKKMSLASVVKDWCDSIDQRAFEQLFADGTDKCLGLFKSITNDDDLTISRLAKLATDLRLEDWDDKMRRLFTANIRKYKETAESYHAVGENEQSVQHTSSYQITYTDNTGAAVTKRFDRVDETGRGKLLYNQVTAAIESMGRSISDQEKRQILIEILKDLC